jgi:hypothetical protein
MITNAILIHLISLMLFAIIYASLPTGTFKFADRDREPGFIDFFNMSTTIQVGVGLTSLYPMTELGISLTTLHQLTMLIKNVFILYLFTQY